MWYLVLNKLKTPAVIHNTKSAMVELPNMPSPWIVFSV